jgi:hypothetical protein
LALPSTPTKHIFISSFSLTLPLSIIRQIISRIMRWARMGEERNVPKRKRPLERPRRRWEDWIKIDLRETG